jgi:arginine exporter protein ArgO
VALAAAAGLAAVLAAAGWVYDAVRIVGAVYLVSFGIWMIVRSRSQSDGRDQRVQTEPRRARPRNAKPASEAGFESAPRETRTPTDHTVHKALNLARLPIPPQARGRRV